MASDDLRTRIAAVLPQIFDRIADGELVEWGDMADALIRELGLTRRTGQGPFSNQVWYQTDWSIE